MDTRVLCTLLAALVAVMATTNITQRDSSKMCQPLVKPVSNTRPMDKVKDDRIVNGEDAVLGQFPHQALVSIDQSAVCGGSLISKKSVLTAAHCTIHGHRFTIRLGGIHRTEYEPTAWISVSVWSKAYPEFNTTGHDNADVSLIFLTEEPPLSRYIKPVALPSSHEIGVTFTGQRALLSGWGRPGAIAFCPEILQWGKVTVISNLLCNKFYDPGVITESTLCASDIDTGACYGDSGSALVIKERSGYKQIGIVSFGPTLCEPEIPTAYARVTSFIEWIIRTDEMRK